MCFDVWGDTVNVAARMEQTGEAGAVQVSESTYRLLSPHVAGAQASHSTITSSPLVDVRGRGQMRTHLLTPLGPHSDDVLAAAAKLKQSTTGDERFHAMFLREYLGF